MHLVWTRNEDEYQPVSVFYTLGVSCLTLSDKDLSLSTSNSILFLTGLVQQQVVSLFLAELPNFDCHQYFEAEATTPCTMYFGNGGLCLINCNKFILISYG